MAEDLDGRFSIKKEWCGYSEPKWVARFCGDWIGSRDTREEAEDLARKWYTNKFGYAPKTEIEWREHFARNDSGVKQLQP